MRRRAKPISDEDRVVADPERSRQRTMNRAVRLLAAKPRSVAELRTRLLEKPWTDAAIVDAVLDKLKGYKYLDDEQYARDVAAAKLRQRPQGRRRLERAMAERKLDRTVIETAVDEAYQARPESDLIDEAIQRRLRVRGVPKTREDTKRLHDHLVRQGFDFGLIRDKLRDIVKLDSFDADA